jgi:hypothetical protein
MSTEQTAPGAVCFYGCLFFFAHLCQGILRCDSRFARYTKNTFHSSRRWMNSRIKSAAILLFALSAPFAHADATAYSFRLYAPGIQGLPVTPSCSVAPTVITQNADTTVTPPAGCGHVVLDMWGAGGGGPSGAGGGGGYTSATFAVSASDRLLVQAGQAGGNTGGMAAGNGGGGSFLYRNGTLLAAAGGGGGSGSQGVGTAAGAGGGSSGLNGASSQINGGCYASGGLGGSQTGEAVVPLNRLRAATTQALPGLHLKGQRAAPTTTAAEATASAASRVTEDGAAAEVAITAAGWARPAATTWAARGREGAPAIWPQVSLEASLPVVVPRPEIALHPCVVTQETAVSAQMARVARLY